MRYRLMLSAVALLLSFPLTARAERATLEFAGGIGDTSLRLIQGKDEIAETSTSLWRVRGRFVLPLSPTFSALFSYERLGDGSGRTWLTGTPPVVARERAGLFEVGFRIGLGRP